MAERDGIPAERTRVVLLARAGDARDRLGEALTEAGAELVLAVDPASADPQEITAARPQAVLVALEPAVEDALDRFDEVLSDPGIAVLFDEAELAAQRAGWDAARWVRHLSAKLNRHDDVLPPGAESDGNWQPSPGPLPSPQVPAALDIAAFADEAQELAAEVPRDDGAIAEVQLDDGIADELARTHSGADALPPTADTLELVDADALFTRSGDAEAPADDDTAAPAAPAYDADALSGLSLADPDSYGHGPLRGAVLVEGGLGGPDAVRQLLAAIPEGFPRPILVRLQLDGGRYDRLVKQMERAATLPVALAETGQRADAGTIYFVPPQLSLVRDNARLLFVEDAGDAGAILAAMPADDSAVLLLSGSDASIVEVAMMRASEGTLVAGQSPDDCYDATAATALSARGGDTGTPAELAGRLAERWPS